MTKKDYKLIAQAICDTRDETTDAGEHPQSAINRVALNLARVFGFEDEQFNKDSFLAEAEFDKQTW